MSAAPRIPTEVPAAIAPLAVLPVFFNLTGRRAVVVGGSAAAAWKAELIAAAGAAVEIFADLHSPEMIAVAARASGKMSFAGKSSDVALANAALVVADAEHEAEAARIHALCRAAGVPCNVIDRPAFCDFQFGTIVNRSPVVIGISTGGVAPVLGQGIRQRIEAVLPAGLAGWARLAGAVRDRVGRLLSPGGERRRFWEALTTDALSGAPAQDFDVEAAISIATTARSREGRVTLVGAGPGDAGLLTLRAVQALQSADVILFDDLITSDVLELARREATRIAVGKRGGREVLPPGGHQCAAPPAGAGGQACRPAEVRRSDDFWPRGRGDRCAPSGGHCRRGRTGHYRRRSDGEPPRRLADPS